MEENALALWGGDLGYVYAIMYAYLKGGNPLLCFSLTLACHHPITSLVPTALRVNSELV